MSNPRDLAALIGPALIAITASEALNIRIFAGNTAPVVYLNGTVLFVSGLAILRAHNRWSATWPVVVTLAGWLFALLGLFRMFAPQVQLQVPNNATTAGIALVFAMGCFLTFKAYWPWKRAGDPA